MSKAGRKPLGVEAPLLCWLLVELERDLKGSARRRSVRDACQRIEARFGCYGASSISRETVRRQYKDAERLLRDTPGGRKQAGESLVEVRSRRLQFGWKLEPAALMGLASDDLAELWSGVLSFTAALELAASRERLRTLAAEHQAVDDTVRKLEAERDQVAAEVARVSGKLN